MEITINSPKTGTADAEGKIIPRSVTVEYDFGGSIEGANTLGISNEVIYAKFESQCATDLGNSLRRILNDPENDQQTCLDFAAKWKPGVVTKGVRRTKEATVPVLIAELKNPETSQERKLAIAEILKAKIAEINDAKAALREVG